VATACQMRPRNSDVTFALIRVRACAPWTFEVLQMSGYHEVMSTIEVPFSRLLQQPKDTMAKLEQSPRRRIRLDRRDGEDLILEAASRAEAEDEALGMASRLFVSLVKSDSGARALLLSLPDVFPWVRFLPKEDVQTFLVELVETIRACVSLDNIAALAPVIAAWQGTAEIYSDPALLKAAAASLDGTDFGEVQGVADR
jgi:hypothetical protein